MNRQYVKNIINITLTLVVIFSICEISDKTKSQYNETHIVAAAQNIKEDEQYIPKDLNYAEMIRAIKKEEGVPEDELEIPMVTDNQPENHSLVSVNPSEYINIAKGCVLEAMIQKDEFRKRQKVKLALRYYKEYLKYYPENIDGLLGAGSMAIYLGREEEAKNILMQAYAMYPKNPDVHKALGDYSFRFSNYNNAIDYYNLSLASGNLKDYATNIATAVCYEKLGDIERAKQYFKVSLYLNPESEIANQRVKMYEAMEYEGYSADPRLYEEAQKPDENSDIELETLILDAQQIK